MNWEYLSSLKLTVSQATRNNYLHGYILPTQK